MTSKKIAFGFLVASIVALVVEYFGLHIVDAYVNGYFRVLGR